MGSASSRSEHIDEKLVERLQAVTMSTKNGDENDFVYLEGEKEGEYAVIPRYQGPSFDNWTAHDHGKPRPQNVSISTFAEWENNLLQDPKVHRALGYFRACHQTQAN